MSVHDDTLDALRLAVEGLSAGHEVAMATVLRTFGSAPRRPGSLWVIVDPASAQPAMRGSVSGGCVEDDLLDWLRERSRSRGLDPGPQRRAYDGATHPGLPCGGTLEVLVEWPTGAAQVRPAIEALEQRRVTWRAVDLASGRVDWHPDPQQDNASVAETPVERGGQLAVPFGPVWRLLLFGGGAVARHLVPQAQALGFDVTVCDPRPSANDGLSGLPAVSLDRRAPERVIAEAGLDARTAVIAVAHDPRVDDLALMDALASPAFYVAAMGGRQTSEARRERLAGLGVDTSRLRAPAGLDIGSHTPAEIAVSIAAELVAARSLARRAAPPGPARSQRAPAAATSPDRGH